MNDKQIDRLEAALAAHVRSRASVQPSSGFSASVLRQVRLAETTTPAQTLLNRALAPFLVAVATSCVVVAAAALRDFSWAEITLHATLYSLDLASPPVWCIS